MNQLGTKTIDHANGAGAIGVKQRRKFADDRKILIDEQALVNNIDLKVANTQTVVAKLEFFRRADNCWITLPFKKFLEQLKLALGWSLTKIDDGDARNRVRLSP